MTINTRGHQLYYFVTSDKQFGFKKQLSCRHAVDNDMPTTNIRTHARTKYYTL